MPMTTPCGARRAGRLDDQDRDDHRHRKRVRHRPNGGRADPAHPAIARDLANPDAPPVSQGLLVQALAARRAVGTPAFTVPSCDNLSGNGELTRGLILDYAGRANPALREWLAEAGAFPACMVDRITPAPGDDLPAKVRDLLNCEDHAAIETETFSQRVIEDQFPTGRPAWEAGGAVLVEDVAPYEKMKLRMLNGAHSMLAYAGFLCGLSHVRDVMRDPALSVLVRRHLRAAAKTHGPVQGIDLDVYAGDLARRFENPNLAHETYQVAMDGAGKLPQRILAPAMHASRSGDDIATAACVRYCLGRRDEGLHYALRAPREDEIAGRVEGLTEADDLAAALFDLSSLFPDELKQEGPLQHGAHHRSAPPTPAEARAAIRVCLEIEKSSTAPMIWDVRATRLNHLAAPATS